MGNVLRVLKRDIIRLLKAPSALIVLIALLVLPSAYTWYNVVGFWDPYSNTGNMRVCVVNEDAGASSELTGELRVGDAVVDALQENSQLKWVFADRDEAMGDLESGRDYAVFVIPSDFTSDILSLTTGEFTQPTIQYYVNEKTGPVSPKVTDTGSTTLEETINKTFVETVSSAVVEAVVSAADDAAESASEGKSVALSRIDDAVASIDDVSASLDRLDTRLAALQEKRAAAESAISAASAAVDSVSSKLGSVSERAYEVEEKLAAASPEASELVGEVMEKLAVLEEVAALTDYGEEVEEAVSSLQAGYASFFSGAIPAAEKGLGKLGSSAAALSASVAGQQTLLDQSLVVLGNIDSLVATARAAASKTRDLLSTARDDLVSVRGDLSTLSVTSELSGLFANGNLDAASIADFIGSPTSIRTEHLYTLSVYGAAMAPLFMNLTFWIGAFMLLVVFRQEVDEEGVGRLTITQRHISRFLYFALPAILQAVVCCAGLLWLGVGVVNVPAMFLAAAVSSLAYLSIIYALSTVFQHVGKGLCVVLVFLQIPAATGLYPIEMTADFYQSISPFFPFTYGISALREAICGFYGTQYASDLAMLGVFFAVALAGGVFLRPLLSNINRMAAREIGETGLMNGERVEVPERKYRISQMLLALTDRAGYKDELRMRYGKFLSRYPRIMKACIAAGILVPALVGLCCMFAGTERVVTLTLWVVWFILLIVLLVALETLRHGFRSQFALNDMSEDELLAAFRAREGMHETEAHEKTRRRAFFLWELDPFEILAGGEAKSDAEAPTEPARESSAGPVSEDASEPARGDASEPAEETPEGSNPGSPVASASEAPEGLGSENPGEGGADA